VGWVHDALNGSPGIERRRFLRRVAAAGLAMGASTFPVVAQESMVRRLSAVGSDQASLGESLAQYAIGLNYEDLPEGRRPTTKTELLSIDGPARKRDR
jgi:hypothetical protein